MISAPIESTYIFRHPGASFFTNLGYDNQNTPRAESIFYMWIRYIAMKIDLY